jgi:hypothetical protein
MTLKRSPLTKAWSVTLSMLMVMSLGVFTTVETGCNSCTLASKIATLDKNLPTLLSTLSGLSQNNPGAPADVVAVLNKISQLVGTDGKATTDALTAYNAAKAAGQTELVALSNAVSAFSADLTPQFLILNGIAKTVTSAQAIANKVGWAVAILNAAVIGLSVFISDAATRPAIEQWRKVQPYIPQDTQDRVAREYGYSVVQLDQLANRFGL